MRDDAPVTPICKWCDDESSRVTEVLVPILQLSVNHPRRQILVLPVVTELRQPLEVIGTWHPWELLDEDTLHFLNIGVKILNLNYLWHWVSEFNLLWGKLSYLSNVCSLLKIVWRPYQVIKWTGVELTRQICESKWSLRSFYKERYMKV